MYIEPSTDIRLLKNVPLDNTYEHTIYFSNANAQANYFIGLTKHNLINYTYQRVQKGVCRVNRTADQCYDCNYMMFRNTAYGTKWFYAFITGVEYVNDGMCQVSFELDVMQTWFFDYELEQCFVEREHSTTDNIYDYTLPEPVDLGEYISDQGSRAELVSMATMDVVVATSFNPTGERAIHGKESGIFNPSYYKIFDSTSQTLESDIQTYLANIIDAEGVDSIISIFLCPHYITNHFLNQPPVPTSHVSNIFSFNPNYLFGAWNDGRTTWSPRNKKMYTYPYNFLYLYDNIGDKSSILQPQYLHSTSGGYRFDALLSFTCNPAITIYPYNYKNLTNNLECGISMNGYPQCAYNIDTVRAWVANGGAVKNLGVLAGSTMTMAGGIASQNPMMAGAGIIGLTNAISELVINLNRPPANRGVNETTPCVADGKYFPIAERRMININSAKAIDNFFTQYGYSCCIVKVPNRNARPHWTYTKTKKCNLKGSAPADEIKKICNVYDRGITFWRNGNEVGNYSLDNSPT